MAAASRTAGQRERRTSLVSCPRYGVAARRLPAHFDTIVYHLCDSRCPAKRWSALVSPVVARQSTCVHQLIAAHSDMARGSREGWKLPKTKTASRNCAARPCPQTLRQHPFSLHRHLQGFFADKDAGAKATGQRVEKPKAPTEQYVDFMKVRRGLNCMLISTRWVQTSRRRGVALGCCVSLYHAYEVSGVPREFCHWASFHIQKSESPCWAWLAHSDESKSWPCGYAGDRGRRARGGPPRGGGGVRGGRRAGGARSLRAAVRRFPASGGAGSSVLRSVARSPSLLADTAGRTVVGFCRTIRREWMKQSP